jgi:hypothetical protein
MVDLILNDERMKTFPLRFGTKQGCLQFPPLSNVGLEVLATKIRQEKEKGMQIERKK